MQEDWLRRWKEGRIGWHEPAGNAALKRHWQRLRAGARVLVPLCGKSVDLRWLADRGCDVTGVEMSRDAIESFFAEQELRFDHEPGEMDRFVAHDVRITIVCGHYLDFDGRDYEAVFDRGALVALSRDMRPAYATHTDSLLRDDAFRLVVTLEYEQSRAPGPPFAVWPDELLGYWPELQRVSASEELDSSPPKFREAGITSVTEAVWCTRFG